MNEGLSINTDNLEKEKRIEELAVKKYEKVMSLIKNEILPNLEKSTIDSINFSNFDTEFGGGSYDIVMAYIEDLKKYIVIDTIKKDDTNYAWDYEPDLSLGRILTKEQLQAERDSYEENNFDDEYRNPTYKTEKGVSVEGAEKGKIINAFKQAVEGGELNYLKTKFKNDFISHYKKIGK